MVWLNIFVGELLTNIWSAPLLQIVHNSKLTAKVIFHRGGSKGGSSGSSEPPWLVSHFAPPRHLWTNIKTNCFSCRGHQFFCFPRPWVDNRPIGVSHGWTRVDEHPVWGDYLPLAGRYRITIQTKNSLKNLEAWNSSVSKIQKTLVKENARHQWLNMAEINDVTQS